jgi:hypothetical protein
MKQITALSALLTLGTMTAVAHEARPVVEAGMSYSFVNFHPGGGAPSFTASGGSGTFVYNFTNRLSAVADLGGHHNTSDANLNPTTFT